MSTREPSPVDMYTSLNLRVFDKFARFSGTITLIYTPVSLSDALVKFTSSLLSVQPQGPKQTSSSTFKRDHPKSLPSLLRPVVFLQRSESPLSCHGTRLLYDWYSLTTRSWERTIRLELGEQALSCTCIQQVELLQLGSRTRVG